MALPSSGTLTMAQIRAEFGAPVGTRLSAFVRGGTWVPNTPQNAGVPTTLPLRARQLLGAAKTPPLSSTTPDAAGQVFNPEPAAASRSVAASNTTTPSGGSGSYTYSRVRISGDVGIGFNGGSTANTCSYIATVPKNATRSATFRVTIDDGQSTVTNDYVVSLTYNTDL